jgi:23S rRNA (cytosine1962-C5)-methyltransferase
MTDRETQLDSRSCGALPRPHDPQMPATPVQRPALIVADRWRDYQLLDCGDGMKQERWGEYTLVRPDPQIIWPRHGSIPSPASASGSAVPGNSGRAQATWEGWDGFYHRSEQGGG